MPWHDSEVIDKKQWNERLFSLRLRDPGLTFKPGQFVRVGVLDGEEVLARPYSLVSHPDEEGFEIYFNIVPEGPLSPRLAALEIGDAVKIADRASGFLTIDEVPECRHLWMMATGTAIGPFISMLNTTLPYERFEKIALCYSVRDRSELAYTDEIERYIERYPDRFIFIPVVTREEVEGALAERIPVAIENGELEARAGIVIDDDCHVMICGSSEMMRDAFDVLATRGLRKHLRREPGHISTEKYH